MDGDFSSVRCGFVLSLFYFRSTLASDYAAASEPPTSSGSPSDRRDDSRSPYVGETVRTSRFELTVDSIESRKTVGGEFLSETAPEGSIYVAVRFTVKNISNQPIGMFSQPIVTLVDQSGTRYESDLGATSTYATEAKLSEKVVSDLNPGVTVTGARVFHVAEDRFSLSTWRVQIHATGTLLVAFANRPAAEGAKAASPATSPSSEPLAPARVLPNEDTDGDVDADGSSDTEFADYVSTPDGPPRAVAGGYRVVHHVAPEFAEGMAIGDLPDHVDVEVTIDTDGNVSDAKLKQPLPGFDGPILAAVRKWRFTRVRIDNVVRSIMTDVSVRLKPEGQF